MVDFPQVTFDKFQHMAKVQFDRTILLYCMFSMGESLTISNKLMISNKLLINFKRLF